MAQGRMLKRKEVRDPRLAQLSTEAELLYLRALPYLDREGRMDGHPAGVRGNVVSLRAAANPGAWSDDRIEGYIAEWTSTVDQDGVVRPLVVWYQVEGVYACQFTSFHEHQTIRYDREAVSEYADPPFDLLSQLPRAVAGMLRRPRAVADDAPDADSGPDAVPGQQTIPGAALDKPDAVPAPDAALALPRDQVPPKAEAEVEVQETQQSRTVVNYAAPALPNITLPQHVTDGALVDRLLELVPAHEIRANTRRVLLEIFSELPAHYIELAREELLSARDVRSPVRYLVRIGQRMLRDAA